MNPAIVFTIAAVLLRVVSNPVGNVFQKQLTSRGNAPLVVNFVTYFLLSIGCLVFSRVRWEELAPAFWYYAIAGGVVGAIGNGFLVKALQGGELSVLGPINSYKAVVGMIIGVFFLREIPNVWGVAGVLVIIGGSYLVLDSGEERVSWGIFRRRDIKYRIWAMIFTAIEAVFVKGAILTSSPGIAFVSWCGFGAVFSFGLLFTDWKNARGNFGRIARKDAEKYLWLAVCMGVMQMSTNHVLKHMAVGYALSLFQLSILLSVVLGHRVFQEGRLVKKLMGAGIMIAGSVMIILLNGK